MYTKSFSVRLADSQLAEQGWSIYDFFFFSRDFADDGEHPLAEAKVYYTRLAEPIGQMWAASPSYGAPPDGVYTIILSVQTIICMYVYIYIYMYTHRYIPGVWFCPYK